MTSQFMTTLHHNDSLNSIFINPWWSVATNLSLAYKISPPAFRWSQSLSSLQQWFKFCSPIASRSFIWYTNSILCCLCFSVISWCSKTLPSPYSFLSHKFSCQPENLFLLFFWRRPSVSPVFAHTVSSVCQVNQIAVCTVTKSQFILVNMLTTLSSGLNLPPGLLGFNPGTGFRTASISPHNLALPRLPWSSDRDTGFFDKSSPVYPHHSPLGLVCLCWLFQTVNNDAGFPLLHFFCFFTVCLKLQLHRSSPLPQHSWTFNDLLSFSASTLS